MPRTDTIIVGAGQAGLAVSAALTDAGHDHVLLERGRVAEQWRSARWESLRLLTPNWMTRLPGWQYHGDDPDGFMAGADVVDFFDRYARSFGAPVYGDTEVEHVQRTAGGYRVRTDQGTWLAQNLVVATGATDRPSVPGIAVGLSSEVYQITPDRYRSPASVPGGGVLVVGASATGVQLADELAAAGRSVVLAAGRHTRGVRRHRGCDIFRWLEDTGKNDTRIEHLRDPASAPTLPSLQLVGGAPPVDVDLAALQRRGVLLTGRLTDASGTRVGFADDLAETTGAADARLARLLREFDAFAATHRLVSLAAAEPLSSVRLPSTPLTRLDLRASAINSIVWATGYRRDYSWLDVPVLDGRGELVQRNGVTPAPGLYVVGLRFQSRRNSNFIDGVRHDARAVAGNIVQRSGGALRLAV